MEVRRAARARSAWRRAAALVLSGVGLLASIASAQDPPVTREAFVAALEMAPGSERARALARGLVNAPAGELDERSTRAFEAFQQAIGALRLEEAETIAVAMHAADPAPWSASTLGLLWTRMGKYEDAERVLAGEIERQEALARENDERARAVTDETVRAQAIAAAARARLERRTLLERRAVARAGAGREARALDDLGRALAEGGRDAAQILAQRALARGRRDEARALFRSLLQPRPGEELYPLGESVPWAARGWGLALLPPPSRPATPGAPPEARRNP